MKIRNPEAQSCCYFRESEHLILIHSLWIYKSIASIAKYSTQKMMGDLFFSLKQNNLCILSNRNFRTIKTRWYFRTCRITVWIHLLRRLYILRLHYNRLGNSGSPPLSTSNWHILVFVSAPAACNSDQLLERQIQRCFYVINFYKLAFKNFPLLVCTMIYIKKEIDVQDWLKAVNLSDYRFR